MSEIAKNPINPSTLELSHLAPPRLIGVGFSEMARYKEFHGTLGNAFEAIGENLSKNDSTSNARLLRDTAIVVNAVLARRARLRAKGKSTSNIESLMPEALDMGAAIYAGDPSACEKVELLKKKIEEQGFLDCTVLEQRNEQKVRAFTAEAMEHALRHFIEFAGRSPILLIAIAEGGTGPGMALIQMHNQFLKEQGVKGESALWLLRNVLYQDLYGNYDSAPLALKREIGMIREQAEGRDVIVYNDHSETGETINQTTNWVYENITKGVVLKVAGITNDAVARVINGSKPDSNDVWNNLRYALRETTDSQAILDFGLPEDLWKKRQKALHGPYPKTLEEFRKK